MFELWTKDFPHWLHVYSWLCMSSLSGNKVRERNQLEGFHTLYTHMVLHQHESLRSYEVRTSAERFSTFLYIHKVFSPVWHNAVQGHTAGRIFHILYIHRVFFYTLWYTKGCTIWEKSVIRASVWFISCLSSCSLNIWCFDRKFWLDSLLLLACRMATKNQIAFQTFRIWVMFIIVLAVHAECTENSFPILPTFTHTLSWRKYFFFWVNATLPQMSPGCPGACAPPPSSDFFQWQYWDHSLPFFPF